MGDTKKVNSQLTKLITKLLKQVDTDAKDDKGMPLYTLTDKMKVVDRALKLEAIRLKADDSGYGTGFGEQLDEDPD